VRSVTRTIKVRPKATLSASATTVKSGATVKLTTKVAPKLAGKEVLLQRRKSDGSWKTVQKGKLDATSARTFSVKASTSTKGSYRVFVPKSDIHADGVSPVVTIKLG
jgi:hypothetical protein